jgi:hypothetical protein
MLPNTVFAQSQRNATILNGACIRWWKGSWGDGVDERVSGLPRRIDPNSVEILSTSQPVLIPVTGHAKESKFLAVRAALGRGFALQNQVVGLKSR